MPFISLPDFLEAAFQRFSDRPASVARGRVLLYRDVERISESFCAWLQTACGIKPGDNVAIILPHSLPWLSVLAGTWRAGAQAIILDPADSPQTWIRSLDETRARVIVLPEQKCLGLKSAWRPGNACSVVRTQPGDLLYFPRNFITTHLKRYMTLRSLRFDERGLKTTPFMETIHHGRHAPLQEIPFDPEKNILTIRSNRTGDTLQFTASALKKRLAERRAFYLEATGQPLREGKETVVNDLPFVTEHGIIDGVLLMCEAGATQILAHDIHDNDELAETFNSHPVSYFLGNAADVSAILGRSRFVGASLNRLRFAGILREEWNEELSQRWGDICPTSLKML